jgi:hypothetical protein
MDTISLNDALTLSGLAETGQSQRRGRDAAQEAIERRGHS